MRLREFIKQNREEIDRVVHSIQSRPNTQGERMSPIKLNDKDREEWVMNEEGLYRWARSSGCRI